MFFVLPDQNPASAAHPKRDPHALEFFAELQREFLNLQQRLQKTVVFVTHDLREALLLGTRIGLMEAGRLMALLTPEEFVRSSEPIVTSYLEAFGADLHDWRTQ